MVFQAGGSDNFGGSEAVSWRASWRASSLGFQKGRQASGQHVFGGGSVLQGHGVLLFRNRPLGLRCGAVLRAWEQLQQHQQQQQQEQQQQAQQLQSLSRFVFTRIQKGRQASGQHVFGGRSVLQGHGVLLFRNRPLGLRCGAVLSGWEQLQQHHQQQQQQEQQHFVFTRIQKGRQASGQPCFWRSFRPSGPWCFAVSQPPARTSLWSCFEWMGAAPAAPAAAAAGAAAAGPAAAIA